MQTSAGSVPVTAVIADRSPHFRETLRRVLQHGGHANVVGEAGTIRDALRLVRRTGAQLILLDIQLVMNQPAGRLRRIVDGLPGLNVIVLLDEDLPAYHLAIDARWGYRCVAKESAVSDLPAVLGLAPERQASHS